MAENSAVRVGIVGIGIAARQVLGSIEQTEGAELAAVCDLRADEVERFKKRYGVEGFTDIEEMCKHGPVDAVWVATPNNFHAAHTILAAAVPPLAVITLIRAFRARFDRHRAIARWTLPVWLYVSVTGVVVYWMLYRL